MELGKGVAAVAVEGGAEAAADAAQGTADAAALLSQQLDAEGAEDAEGAAFGFGPRRSRRPSDSMHDAQELHEPEPESESEPEPEPKPEPEPEP